MRAMAMYLCSAECGTISGITTRMSSSVRTAIMYATKSALFFVNEKRSSEKRVGG